MTTFPGSPRLIKGGIVLLGYFTMLYEYISNDNLADDFWTLRAPKMCR